MGCSRRVSWERRPEAAALLEQAHDVDRPFDAVVVGEFERAFTDRQFEQVARLLRRDGVLVWLPEAGGPVDLDAPHAPGVDAGAGRAAAAGGGAPCGRRARRRGRAGRHGSGRPAPGAVGSRRWRRRCGTGRSTAAAGSSPPARCPVRTGAGRHPGRANPGPSGSGRRDIAGRSTTGKTGRVTDAALRILYDVLAGFDLPEARVVDATRAPRSTLHGCAALGAQSVESAPFRHSCATTLRAAPRPRLAPSRTSRPGGDAEARAARLFGGGPTAWGRGWQTC